MITEEIVKVHRSRIWELSFKREDVLVNEGDKTMRRLDLERAMKLGNTYKQSVTLQFKTSDNVSREVTATVWAVTEKNVELKGGKIIPISSIFRVEL